MTGPAVTPNDPGRPALPPLSRILSPDEFHQARQLSPEALQSNPFPLLPPAAPKDAVSTNNPNAPTTKGVPLTGIPRLLTKYIAQPMMDHPLMTAATGVIPYAGYVAGGLMAKDVLEYGAQKAAEQTLPKDVKAMAEADPTRISGEQAAMEAGMLAVAPLVHAAIKGGTAIADTPIGQTIKGHVAAVTDSWQSMFSPANRTPESGAAASIIRSTTGHGAANYEQAAFKLDEFRRAIDPLPMTDQLGFIDAYEGGQSQPSPEFQSAADAIHGTLDAFWNHLVELTPDAAAKYRENYLPHIYTDASRAGDFFKAAKPEPSEAHAAPSESSSSTSAPTPASPVGQSLVHVDPTQAALAKGKSVNWSTDLWNLVYGKKLTSLGDEQLSHVQQQLEANYESTMGTPAQEAIHRDLLNVKNEVARRQDFVRPRTTYETELAAETDAAKVRKELDRHEDYLDAGLTRDDKIKAERVVAIAKQRLKDLSAESPVITAVDPASTSVSPATATGGSLADKNALQNAKIRTGGKAPFEGSKAYLKRRTFDTLAEAMQAGLVPVTTNPIDLALVRIRDMQKYITAHTTLNELKDNGLVKYVASGEIPPDGYRPIDDKIATVFGPRNGAVTLPEGPAKGVAVGPRGGMDATGAEAMQPEDVGVLGQRIMGKYHAPESVALLVNNYLSPGLRGNAIYDAYRGLGNTLNQAQLGFSAFHLGMTSLDASVSRAALGIEHLSDGDLLTGAAKIAASPLAPIPGVLQGTIGDASNHFFGTKFQWGLGAKIRDAYLNPDAAPPEMVALANAVKEAGGRVKQDSFYENSAPQKLVEAWKQGEYGKATALSIPALLEGATKPLMEHVVPLQKLGVFGEMAQKALADLPDEATLGERRAALSKAWDSVDNRMGQLVYDNLFWNKTFKDLAMGGVRSVGWNLGTIRELGGGAVDLAKAVTPGAQFEMTHKAAYALALPMTVGLYGAAYQYLRTGEGPSEFKDYFFPKTGEVDADGNPERVQLPSYMKDVFSYADHPVTTVGHKFAPLLSSIQQMLANQDFYGDEIRNPDDDAVTQLGQEAKYIGKTVVPFSLQGLMEDKKRGDQSPVTKFGNWFGITPAPREKVRSDAENRMADILSTRHTTGATPEDAAARQSRSEILAAMRGGNKDGTLEQAVTDAIERHQLTPPDIGKLLKRAGSTPGQEKFKMLTLPQAIDVFNRGTDTEKAKFAELLLKKIGAASK